MQKMQNILKRITGIRQGEMKKKTRQNAKRGKRVFEFRVGSTLARINEASTACHVTFDTYTGRDSLTDLN
jgi:hypothetical protein